MTELGRYDKETKKFFKRDETTIAPFPEINREALAMMYDVLSRALDQNGKVDFTKVLNSQNYSPQFKEATKSHNFGRFYATAINELDRNQETVKSFEGEWRKYPQSNNPADAEILFNDIHGKGTGWCTAGGINTAESHLSGGDFYVYYCYDQNGQPTTPKIAIRTENGTVAEVRGTDANQNLGEEELVKIAQEKYHDMPGGDKYDKKTADMARLTEIHRKFYSFKDGEYIRKNSPEELSANDLRFLYQINGKIKGFGYGEDPRIKQILNERDARSDLATCFNCAPEQISLTKEEALSGNIVYHYGDLDLSDLTSAEGVTFPESIGGGLNLRSLTSAEGVTFPESIGGGLNLESLTSGEGLDLSGVTIGGGIYLESLTSAEGLKLPETIGGNLDLGNLTSAEGVTFPGSISGSLNLSRLTSAEGLKLPETIGGGLYLESLTSAEGLKLPETIGGNLDLGNLTSAERLDLSGVTISGDLYFDSLTSAEKDQLRLKHPHLNII